MGLQVSNVNVKTRDGDTVTSFWIEVDVRLVEKPSPSIQVTGRPFRSETDQEAGYNMLQLVDTGAGLATDVPSQLRNINDTLTAGQYANLDMGNVHNRYRDVLIQGDSHADWATLFGTLVWAGFGVGNVVTDMPA